LFPPTFAIPYQLTPITDQAYKEIYNFRSKRLPKSNNLFKSNQPLNSSPWVSHPPFFDQCPWKQTDTVVSTLGPGCTCSCGSSCSCPTGQCTCVRRPSHPLPVDVRPAIPVQTQLTVDDLLDRNKTLRRQSHPHTAPRFIREGMGAGK